ncbi:type III-B CRISPR module RAMP protein Cmr6 [Sphingobacteriales bacterium UPWRP_1]|nr:type III-B CRISPR module RAMP protein Cmr6 [Sphingobacteriales bacterium UPWRP_1]
MQKAARYERDMGKGTYKFLFFKKDDRERVYFEIRANYGHFKDNFDALCKRQSQQAESLFPNNAIKILLQPQWRLVLGLGGESVYETSMTLHHLYGIPYLPASSIKGVLRSWVISQIFAQPENVPDTEKNHPLVNAEYRAITQSKLFCTIFGCPKDSKKVIFEGGHPKIKIEKGEEKYVYDESELSALGNEHQGIVTFFDAFPTSAPIVKADVMNVHYKDWYKDVSYSPPTDTQRTNPVLFLTVSNENNLQFQTYIAISDDKMKLGDIQGHERFLSDSGLNADSYLLDLVKYWLTQALTQHGIGAKTAVGYGYMTDTQPTQ